MQLLKLKIDKFDNKCDYPFSIPLLITLKEIRFTKPVTIFVGENGSGKSTLIESLAIACNLATIGNNDINRDKTLLSAKELADKLTLSWISRNHKGFFMRAEDFFGFQKRIIESQLELKKQEREFESKFSGYAKILSTGTVKSQRIALEKKYGENPDAFSHGESFLNLFINRIVPEGLYILDEPEVPLSPLRQLSLISIIKDQVSKGSQFIIATHSPILMALPGAEIYEIKNGEMKVQDYSNLEHVKLMKEFLANPQMYIKRL